MKSKALTKFHDEETAKINSAVERLDEAAALIEETLGDDADVSTCNRVAQPIKLFVKRDLTSEEKMADVARDLLRRLAAVGFRITAKEGECPYSDYPEIGRREWALTGDVLLALFVPYDGGGACRFVKTGTKEEDVYELVCD